MFQQLLHENLEVLSQLIISNKAYFNGCEICTK